MRKADFMTCKLTIFLHHDTGYLIQRLGNHDDFNAATTCPPHLTNLKKTTLSSPSFKRKKNLSNTHA
jgi:hypothetical protein